MPRKKRTNAEAIIGAPAATAVNETPVAAALPPMERPAYIDGPPAIEAGAVEATPEPKKEWGDPYKRIFSSTVKGFEMGENRRFKQRVFKFHERPDQAVIDTLKDNGFTYRPNEKSWTIQVSPDTRRLSEELAQQFSGEALSFQR